MVVGVFYFGKNIDSSLEIWVHGAVGISPHCFLEEF
jgi:hypothetical protein